MYVREDTLPPGFLLALAAWRAVVALCTLEMAEGGTAVDCNAHSIKSNEFALEQAATHSTSARSEVLCGCGWHLC